ncbi:Helicase conserved C-terminal domain-containing protein [Agrococcus baldri]|uniref:Helicase conserved C-terminal domain-containing protein n=1 Tax=Agrococcus baldri TaxID=153730 RepID=A0AA94HLX7_9MICO|nr:DUF3427 domain-containing protein [Agrococcus baldri]SFS08774.1 Helicase conserved C-terminal domain-containing protein [Agrococcus baldri]
MNKVPFGVHDSLLTAELLAAIDSMRPGIGEARFAALEPATLSDRLTRHISGVVRRHLAALSTDADRLDATNELVSRLEPGLTVRRQDEILAGVVKPVMGFQDVDVDRRPLIGFHDSALITNAPKEPSLASQLNSEFATAESIDLLCAFVKYSGIRLLERQLRRAIERGVPVRVITSTYLGASDAAAIEHLTRLGATVKVNYNTASTRLHAKAWLFERNGALSTAYIGSSNLSSAAIVDGLEWNVRLSDSSNHDLVRKFRATFESYWNDSAFEDYDTTTDRDRLRLAIAQAAGGEASRFGFDSAIDDLPAFDINPLPHQQEILEDLEGERSRGNHRNLVVAATGTGKTVVAALDYRLLSEQQAGRRPRLLFIAHRQEILRQARATFRAVLKDGSFGEILTGELKPTEYEHVFASVASLHSKHLSTIDPKQFEIVILDEAHHVAARGWRLAADHFEHQELLGLTATPERGDGKSILDVFDGRIASELRLWDALSSDLLSPFHYFGIADDVDLSGLKWARGGYDSVQLSAALSHNAARAGKVVDATRRYLGDTSRMRALAFCVSVEHATFMAEAFTAAGFKVAAIVAGTPKDVRERAVQQLRQGGLQAIFCVDVFNEGVDIPEIDTVLFLRPTESVTVFLQQLGRGLRRSQGKSVLTVLDFVSKQSDRFSYADRFRALTGVGHRHVVREIEEGFPTAPPGSQIILDRESQETVLANVKRGLRASKSVMASDLRELQSPELDPFLRDSGWSIEDVYRSEGTWTGLRRLALNDKSPIEERTAKLLKRSRSLAHVDDPERADAYSRILRGQSGSYGAMTERDRVFAEMLFFSVWPGNEKQFTSFEAGLAELRSDRLFVDENLNLLEAAKSASHVGNSPAIENRLHLVLSVHARYSREEILPAIRYSQLGSRRPNSIRQGVVYSKTERLDAFMVTLMKAEHQYSPTTMYNDYAISPTLMHWESQAGTREDSPTGQRYINHVAEDSAVVLFVREEKDGPIGTSPYVCIGGATYVEHEGELPMAIKWKLDKAMPTTLFQVAAAVS